MSQQEFMRPEQDYDATQQQVESDFQVHHRELTGEHPAWEQHDATSRSHLVGEKLHPQPSQLSRPSPLHILIVSLALILFITLGTFAFKINQIISLFQSATVQGYYSHPHNETRSSLPSQLSFAVTGPVKLSINDMAAGTIRIHAGDTNRVVVSETSQDENKAFTSDALPFKPVQDGNALNISIDNDLENADSTGVILDVYTPRDTSVNINADSASVNIDNVDGQIIANTKDGSITATNDNMSDSSSLQTEDGDINFTGSFDTKGTYQFSSESGAINISVPANSSFRLNTTGVSAASIMNEFGGNVVGNHPDATVTILSQKGSVALHKV
jgi:hypothetical protein